MIGRSVLDIDIWKDLDQRKILLDEVFEKGFAHNWEAVFRTKAGDLHHLSGFYKKNRHQR